MITTSLMRDLRVVCGIGLRGTKAWITSPPYVVITLLFPLLFLAAFDGALSAFADLEGFAYREGYTAFVYGFVILQAAAFGGIFTGYSTGRDFDTGVARRLLVGAAKRAPIVAGYVVVAVVRAFIAMAVLTGVAMIMGMRTQAGAGQIALLVITVGVMATAASLWACGVAMRTKTTRGGPLMYTPILVALFLTPVYVPVKLLDGWLRWLVSANPVTYVVDGSRSLVAGTNGDIVSGLAWCVIVSIVLTVWAIRGIQRANHR